MKSLSVAKTILAVLRNGGQGSMNTIIRHPYTKIFCRTKRRNTFNTALTRLKRDGIVSKAGNMLTLSPAGQKAALFAFIDAEVRLFRPGLQKWDGGWRIVFFDVPEAKRHYRDYLRSVLKSVGFREFQRSVWVYPYQVPAFLKELLLDSDIKPHVRFISAQKVEFDQDLRNLFSIK